MISDALKQQILFYISLVIFFQLAAISVLALATVVLMRYRNWHEKKITEWAGKYADLLVDELLEIENPDAKKQLVAPTAQQRIQKKAMKETLLEHIRSLSGPERSYLIRRYQELGFVKDDLFLAASSLWPKRLEGVANLSDFHANSLAPFFHKMKDDPHLLVSMKAYLSLSELEHEQNEINLKILHHFSLQKNQSLVIEMMSNWCKIYGFALMLQKIKNESIGDLANILIPALLSVKTAESSAALTLFLDDAWFEEPALINEIITGLKDIGDPEAIVSVRRYLEHPDAGVRERACEFTLLFGAPEDVAIIERDTAPSVKRLLLEWRGKTAA